MSAYPTSLGPISIHPPARKKYWQRFGGKFLFISIAIHILFGLGAAYYVVMMYAPKKITLRAGSTPGTVIKDIKQKVKQAEQRNSSAPMPMQRAVTMGISHIVVEKVETPTTSNHVAITPMSNSWDGPGLTPGTGNGLNGPGGGGASTGFHPPLGDTVPKGGALKGLFYDLKLTTGKKETGITSGEYSKAVSEFVSKGWNKDSLSKYLKGTNPLYATQIFFPEIDTTAAPKAFGSPVPDSSGLWIAVYRGEVMAPESGTYHFVGAGDDDMYVRFDGKLVLDNCEHIDPQIQAEGVYHYTGLRNKFVKGTGFTVEAGKYYKIEILIGDQIPTKTMAALLIEKEGVTYAKDNGSPILPPFVTDESGGVTDDSLPAHVSKGPVWKGKREFSIFDPKD